MVRTEDDVVEKHILEGGVYRLDGEFRDRIEFSGLGLPGVVVDLTKVW